MKSVFCRNVLRGYLVSLAVSNGLKLSTCTSSDCTGAASTVAASVDRLKMDVETGLRRWCIVCDFDETLADAATVDAASVQSDDVQVLSFSPFDAAKETK